MSIFSNILSKLGFKQPAAQAKPAVAPPATIKPMPKPAMKPVTKAVMDEGAPKTPAAATPPAVVAIPVVDVVGQLEKLAKGKDLDWKVSIVDLMKLLGLDSSFNARKELAKELGCPADKMGDSAQMNTWLHKTVLQKLAENGGNIPKELL